MREEQVEAVVESIYEAALDPERWGAVMAGLRCLFQTGAEALYFLDYDAQAMRPVRIDGIDSGFFRSFRACFYTEDNPCTRAEPLHRPGAVRTDDHLVAYFRDPQILRRSQYFNEWMRPQDLEHSMGTTLLAHGPSVLNLSLLRPGGVGGFSVEEIAVFTRLCGHLQRGMRIAGRLDTLTEREHMTVEALDRLDCGVAFVDADGRLVACNAAAEALLRDGTCLGVRAGRLTPAAPAERDAFDALLRPAAWPARSPAPSPCGRMVLRPRGDGAPLTVQVMRLPRRQRGLLAPRAAAMVLMSAGVRRGPDLEHARAAYGLTPAEARLAAALADGTPLRRAAEAAGMTYETARWYLKILFQKTQTARQAELVARLHAVPLPPAAPGRRLPPAADGGPA